MFSSLIVSKYICYTSAIGRVHEIYAMPGCFALLVILPAHEFGATFHVGFIVIGSTIVQAI